MFQYLWTILIVGGIRTIQLLVQLSARELNKRCIVYSTGWTSSSMHIHVVNMKAVLWNPAIVLCPVIHKPESPRGCSARDQDPIQLLFQFNSIECSSVSWYRGRKKDILMARFTRGQLDSSSGIHQQFQGRLNPLGDNDPGIEIDNVTVGDGGEYLAEVNFTDQSGALQSHQLMSKIQVPQLSVGESPTSLWVPQLSLELDDLSPFISEFYLKLV